MLRILLAEDHLLNQKLALSMLQRLGYQADVVGNGLEVLEAIQQRSYDVVLLDVQMPVMDGLETAKRISQQQARPRLIAMTANAMMGDREACLRAGMDDYISKPVMFVELARVLQRCQPSVAPLNAPEKQSTVPIAPDAPLTPAIDSAALQKLRREMGDWADAVLIELIDCYLTDTPGILQSMQDAIDQQCVDKLHHAAHALKSASAALGANFLSLLCHRVEDLGDLALSSDSRQAEQLLARIQAEYDRVQIALQQEREYCR